MNSNHHRSQMNFETTDARSLVYFFPRPPRIPPPVALPSPVEVPPPAPPTIVYPPDPHGPTPTIVYPPDPHGPPPTIVYPPDPRGPPAIGVPAPFPPTVDEAEPGVAVILSRARNNRHLVIHDYTDLSDLIKKGSGSIHFLEKAVATVFVYHYNKFDLWRRFDKLNQIDSGGGYDTPMNYNKM
ncbi:uncharacterized protein LOC130015488 [Mercurialis annua]|uniref:uncharacterized protein LOC130015488 n=1 Tax=Mercurialis annua TaxID=3986 RepID=UPI0024ACF102|nr:uncharacterized protein LOC130015488 [Mercurialis annua]